MLQPELPARELERMDAVLQYQLLDTLPESDYDNITQLVSTICDVPIALISILDTERNYLKSHHGIPFNESPRAISFCGHAILSEDPIFIVKDARLDARFYDNPLTLEANAIFYAGVPLINPDGYSLGTLCVFDHKPRELSDLQIEALLILGKQVVNLFELHRKNIILQETKKELLENNVRLNNFASHVSHDLKSPLANIMSLTALLKVEMLPNLSSESADYLSYIDDSVSILKDYIDGMLLYYKADELVLAQKEDVLLTEICENISRLLISKNDVFNFSEGIHLHNIHKSALTQILINLVDNALKYNDSDQRKVHILYQELPLYHKFSVTDNGIGIVTEKQESIFQLFNTISKESLKPSSGIGLSAVKNIITKLGGNIIVSSKLNQGSTFTFTIKK